jgi:hypothetical protein
MNPKASFGHLFRSELHEPNAIQDTIFRKKKQITFAAIFLDSVYHLPIFNIKKHKGRRRID